MKQIIRELISVVDKRVLSDIYYCTGFDWNKPFKASIIRGKTTVKQMIKSVAIEGCRCRYVAIMRGSTSEYGDMIKRSYIVTFDETGKICIDHRLPYTSNLDYLFRKGDFDILRKWESTTTFVFAQDIDKYFHVAPRYRLEKEPTQNERYTIAETKSSNGYTYSRIKVKDENGNVSSLRGFGYWINNVWKPFTESDELTDIIDKSGYLVFFSRMQYFDRARERRNNRAKLEYINAKSSIDNKIKTLRMRVDALKGKIIFALNNAKTYEQYRDFSYKFSRSVGSFCSIVYDVELLEEKHRDNDFLSLDAFTRRYTNILVDIEKLENELKKEGVA